MSMAVQRIPTGILVLIAVTIAIGALVAGALLLSGNQALADGGQDSPAECEKPLATDTSQDSPFTAPAGQIVTGVCIKSGDNTFTGDKQHSELITTNGTFGNNDCFVVSGIGTSTVSVTINPQASDCKGVSHIDVKTETAPTPTSTPAPTAPAGATSTPTSTSALTPTATPTATPTGQVLGVTALPDTGQPPGGSSNWVLPLLALGGLLLLGGAGTFAVVKVRRRR